MNKALFIYNDNKVIVPIKERIKEYVDNSQILTLSGVGSYKPTKVNIEKSLQWLRCNKCDSLGLLRCNHGYKHNVPTTLYLVIDLRKSGNNILSSDDKIITQDYIFSNLFYALPENVRLWAIVNVSINSLEFKLEKTSRDTLKIEKQSQISLRSDIIVVSLSSLVDFRLGDNIIDTLDSTSSISFTQSFHINTCFLSPLKS